MAYGSKTLSRKLAALANAAQGAVELGPAVAAALEPEFLPLVEPGAEIPDFRAMLDLIARELKHHEQQLGGLHQRHHHAMAVEKHLRLRQREAAVALRRVLVEVRFLLDEHFGKRRGVANFEGRDDLQRLPMVSLERISAGLLALLGDETFDWRSYPRQPAMENVREKLAEELESYRTAALAVRQAHGERTAAAASAKCGYAEGDRRLAQLYAWLAGVLKAAGYREAARQLRPKRAAPSRRRKAGGEPADVGA